VFAVPNSENRLAALLEREQLNGDDVDRLVLAREVRSTGRSSSRVNGHIVNLRLLRRITAGLVDIHGQSEHLSLMRVREHIYLLDRYAGLEGEREKVSGLVRQLYEVRSELSQLLHDERELARKVDLLTYQIDEIRNAALQPGEEESLQEERTRLANAEQLAALADEAYTYLEGQIDEMPAIQDLLGQTVRALAGLAKIDASQATLQQAAEQVSFQVDDLSHLLRDYREQIEFNPGRLAAVEERIELIRRLQRKYGDSIEDVLAYAKSAAAELEAISHSEERMAELEEQEGRLLREIGRLASALSGERRAAATRMAAAVEQELADLRMTGARFGVDISWRPDPDGAVIPSTASGGESGQAERIAFDASGLDRVEFLISRPLSCRSNPHPGL
jgi:DNA repair protein RecN (Recombination protein N)